MTKIVDIVLFSKDRVLLVQQRKQNVYGLWGLPGGHVEENETPEVAITREINEELGLIISLNEHRKVEHVAAGRIEKGRLMVATFIVPWVPQTIVLQEDELIGFGWFTLAELKELSASLRSSWILEIVEQSLSRKV